MELGQRKKRREQGTRKLPIIQISCCELCKAFVIQEHGDLCQLNLSSQFTQMEEKQKY
jgi:hypothetical protein